jgi:hypothetical protein
MNLALVSLAFTACAPRIMQATPAQGPAGTTVRLSMEYLVGWPRVEVAGQIMDYHQLKLLGLKPESKNLPGEELTWLEDKVLQFRIPDHLPPGDYRITVYDDKGPPGDTVYSVLETTAYLLFPPVWPFVLRSNQTNFTFLVTAE